MGQVGNQMFDYAMGKVIAERTGLRYKPPPRWLDKRGRPLRWTNTPLFLPVESPGDTAHGQSQNLSVTHWIDLDELDPTRPIVLSHGYYQRYELFRPYKDRIRNEWLKIQPPFVTTLTDAVYIHVRRTDYVDGNPEIQGLSTTIDEYAKCLEHFPDAKQLVIVTDNPRDPFHKQFDKIGLPWAVSGLNWDEDFMLLASCKWMIMSQSTYSWWAGFLGRAETIVCPMGPGTFWHHGIGLYGPADPDYPNLYVDDEPERWIFLK